uniref:Uncharacterized protein n=1 Tax=Anguilla anguilla TaxID=7936 RepID=A0A0E9V0R1_ANGAN
MTEVIGRDGDWAGVMSRDADWGRSHGQGMLIGQESHAGVKG